MQPNNRKKLRKIAIILTIIGITLLILFLGWKLFLEKDLLFRKNEEKLLSAAKQYYMQYPGKLPSKVGDSKKLTLDDLYRLEYLDHLMIPGSSEICSQENSWVKVFKEEENDYTYYVYLECGKYKSKVDAIGPEITLEGDEVIYVPLGSTYTDPGIKAVKDNADGELNKEDVAFDTSTVDTTKIGEYKVKYIAYDKMKNKGEATRTVYVVRNILDEVKANTGESYTYRGKDANNYIYYSGMLWRIVKVNEDGTLKLVLDDNVVNLEYKNNGETFENSNAAKWLNEVFYPALRNADTYVKQDSTWCQKTTETAASSNPNCETYSKTMPVGMLTNYEYLNSFDLNGTTYFNNQTSFWLLDQADETESYIVYNYNVDKIIPYNNNSLVGIRPVINLKTDSAYVISGTGSGANPYKLNDYDYGKDGDLISTRYIGEYINYSGQYFRIAGFDQEGNVKLISAGTMLNSSTDMPLLATYSGDFEKLVFDPSVEGNLGYQLNQEMINYLNDSLLIEHEFTRPNYEPKKKYNEYTTETFKAKLSIPTGYDLFSGVNNSEQFVNINYWYLDTVNKKNHFLMMNTRNGIAFDVSIEDFSKNAVKIVTYMKKDAKIASGKGTVLSPYYVK